MKSLICLVEEYLIDSLSTTPVQLQSCMRDLTRLRDRVKNEGESFLKLILPEYSKALLQCLEAQRLLPEAFKNKFRLQSNGFPVLFQGYLYEIFDKRTGILLASPDIECIRVLRQVCVMCSKIKAETPNKQKYNAERQFLECDEYLRSIDFKDVCSTDMIRAVGRVLWTHVLDDYVEKRETLAMRHGPGAVSDPKVKGSQKYKAFTYDKELEARFPFADTMFANYNHWATYLKETTGVLSQSTQSSSVVLGSPDPVGHSINSNDPNSTIFDMPVPVRVVFVPKTCKGPRTIAIEPVHMQFVQQGIKSYLYEKLESHYLTKGHINFADQTVNQELAYHASKDRLMTTLDLSEASDRVSLQLVEEIFSANPDFLSDIKACRTKHARLPSGKIVPLVKFASMGSALCFPVEAMVFYTIIVSAILRATGKRATISNIRNVADQVYVYGDDIVFPSHYHGLVIRSLERAGLKVNKTKTFSQGHFRESCGKEYYAGVDVTPIYLRIDLFSTSCNRADDPTSVSSYWAFRNSMYRLGLWRLVSKLDEAYTAKSVLPNFSVRRLLTTYDQNAPFIGRRSFLGFEVHRYDKNLQCFRSRGYVVKSSKSKAIDGYEALHRYFVEWSPNRETSCEFEVLRDTITITFRK